MKRVRSWGEYEERWDWSDVEEWDLRVWHGEEKEVHYNRTRARKPRFPLQFFQSENWRPWPDWNGGENRGNLENSNSCNFLGIGDEQPARVINWQEIENCGAIIKRRTGENGDQNIWKIHSRIPLHHHFFRPNWQQVKQCWRGYKWVNHILNNLLFCRCFLEGGGSTDSFFVREDLQVDLMD